MRRLSALATATQEAGQSSVLPSTPQGQAVVTATATETHAYSHGAKQHTVSTTVRASSRGAAAAPPTPKRRRLVLVSNNESTNSNVRSAPTHQARVEEVQSLSPPVPVTPWEAPAPASSSSSASGHSGQEGTTQVHPSPLSETPSGDLLLPLDVPLIPRRRFPLRIPLRHAARGRVDMSPQRQPPERLSSPVTDGEEIMLSDSESEESAEQDRVEEPDDAVPPELERLFSRVAELRRRAEGRDGLQFRADPHLHQLLRVRDILRNLCGKQKGLEADTIDACTLKMTLSSKPEADKKGPAADTAQTQCMICLEEFQAGETLRVLPCFHRYHQACVDNWFSRSACCPVCKHDVTSEDSSMVEETDMVPGSPARGVLARFDAAASEEVINVPSTPSDNEEL